MKILIYKILVFILIISAGCGDERSNIFGYDTRLKIMNTQNVDYYYCTSYTYPSLELVVNRYSTRYTVAARSTDIYTTHCCWEERLEDCCDSYLILNFFTKENYEKNSWDTIIAQNLIDTQMIFTVNQLDSMDWFINL